MRSLASYVRRHHIGLLALFVALGGTAYAVQQAPKDSVVSKSIKDGQVKPRDVKLTRTIEYPALVSVPANTSVPQEPFSVKVPKSGLVSIFAESVMSNPAPPGKCVLGIKMNPAPQDVFIPLLRTSTFAVSETRFSAPGTGGDGVSSPAESRFVTYPAEPGKQQFGISYRSQPDEACSFSETKLIVRTDP